MALVNRKDNYGATSEETSSSNRAGREEPDINLQDVVKSIKDLNINNYASRKSLAQGMLDLALLTANASQLKYILSVGDTHEFYQFLLVMIVTSITLQVVQAIIIVILGIVFDINNTEEQKKANIVNNVLVGITTVSVLINIIISAFDMRETSHMMDNTTKAPLK